MSAIAYTSQQRQAIETTGQSVIVSAAAGSGKTAVLAQRCAYLVCDAPSRARCDVDELLVLTFTDAAAAEMRSRIIDAIRARSEVDPDDGRLAQQFALAEAAHISTIHAFCLWLVRRWFTHVEIDPAAAVLDAEEIAVLKREVLDTLFSELYEETREPEHPLGHIADEAPGASDAGAEADFTPPDTGSSRPGRSKTQLGPAFKKLVDDYGLGDDRGIADFVLKLYGFTASLPGPDRWLSEAYTSLVDRPESYLLAVVRDLTRELQLQFDHCERLAADLEAGHDVGLYYAGQIRDYAKQVTSWLELLPAATNHTEADNASADDHASSQARLSKFELVRSQIAEFAFARSRAPTLPKDPDPAAVKARDTAQRALGFVKESLFNARLKNGFAQFTSDELIDGLTNTAPYIRTIVELVGLFRDAYTRKKRELNALDFADLERLAFDLLRDNDNPEAPSEVARSLHRRFAYVLVDEFQDINPLQEAIIRLVSREVDPESDDNLFVVGDVKQSIYRFRLAEPTVFSARLDRFRRSSDKSKAIFLQDNFRSAPEILDGVNLVFRQLMREGCSDVVYDEEAKLTPGRIFESKPPRHPIELHLLERTLKGARKEDEILERGTANLSDPAQWTPIEREAHLIGLQIRHWIESGRQGADGHPVQLRDIAVLLRATRINAEHVASMLSLMGVPAFADVGGSLFDTREVRDVLAALQVLDNLQQDIPLAGVLRSGIFEDPLSVDELATIRCLDRAIPFHEAVRTFARRGEPIELRDRLRSLLNRTMRYRSAVRNRPLADVLWSIYKEQGYLAYVGGLPNGPQRRANLLWLHELARHFSSFRRQGLHRFLRFVQSLQEDERDMATAPAIGEAEDVVRVMSIHQAKGLEFPVVFVAGLGTRFNLGDRSGRLIFERKSRIGLRVVDTERMIEYPSAAHRQAAFEIEQSTRAEELRVLYVAMTRARDRLVLVGSQPNVRRHQDAASHDLRLRPPSVLSILTAITPLDWLIPALVRGQPDAVRGLGRKSGPQPLFDVLIHDADEMSDWDTMSLVDDDRTRARRAVAKIADLPAEEPLATGESDADAVLATIDFVYPHLASASIKASMAASEFKGAFDYTKSPEEQPPGHDGEFQLPPSKYGVAGESDAIARGVITHRVLQNLDFKKATDQAGVAAELQRMTAEGVVPPDAAAMVDLESLAWFVSTPLADAIRDAGAAYRREFSYITAEAWDVFDRSVDAPSDDHVLVRGIVDGILPAQDGLEIVDFKTDAVRIEDLEERAERYRPQMELYVRAMARLWQKPVRKCWLVFLAPRKLACWHDPGGYQRPKTVQRP